MTQCPLIIIYIFGTRFSDLDEQEKQNLIEDGGGSQKFKDMTFFSKVEILTHTFTKKSEKLKFPLIVADYVFFSIYLFSLPKSLKAIIIISC